MDNKKIAEQVEQLKTEEFHTQQLMFAAKHGVLASLSLQNLTPKMVNTTDNTGNTPVMLAATVSEGFLSALLSKKNLLKIDINHQNNKGFSALMLAVQAGHTSCASTLLTHGANINLQNNEGKTALMLAENSFTLEQLLADPSQLDLSIVDNQGRTAMDLVSESNREILESVYERSRSNRP